MGKCLKNTKHLFGLFPIHGKHLFLITNVFCTLESADQYDVIRTCQICSFKEAMSMDKLTLIESAVLFPNVFNSILKDYIGTWINTK